MSQREYLRTLLYAAAIGIPAAAAGVLLQSALHHTTEAVWQELPEAVGWAAPPWWYVLLVPAVAGLLVAATLRLPGRGGHAPLEGLPTDPVAPLHLASILPAAFASLALGLVLGPEAPLLALGLAVGVVAVRLVGAEGAPATLLPLAAAFSVLAGLFGGPIPAALLLFEAMAASGRIPAAQIGRALLPGLVAAGTGALVYTGVRGWPGVEQVSLALPGVPAYPTVRIADVAWSMPIALVVAVVVVSLKRLALEVAGGAARRPGAALVVAGLLVGALAVAFRAATDRPVDLVLFSGQASLPAILAETSAGVLTLVVVAKGLAYALSLGAGFRGGLVFPALVLGATVGMVSALVLPGLEPAPALAVGLASSAAAVLGLPIFAVVMAALLLGESAIQVAPLAILGAAVGWVVSVAAARE